ERQVCGHGSGRKTAKDNFFNDGVEFFDIEEITDLEHKKKALKETSHEGIHKEE
ncbi:6702_t:CDS:1, partial [Gigaspora rosea]